MISKNTITSGTLYTIIIILLNATFSSNETALARSETLANLRMNAIEFELHIVNNNIMTYKGGSLLLSPAPLG